MAPLDIATHPTTRELRWFGVRVLVAGGVAGALAWWWTGSVTVPRAIWIAVAAVTATCYGVPPARRPIFIGWTYTIHAIGWLLSSVVLAAIFYIVFTVVGTLMRVVGYDPLARGIDRRSSSYWVAREPVDDVQRYFRQY